MLTTVNRNVKHCYERALAAAERAANAKTPVEREVHLDNERRWLGLAASYEYTESLTNFIRELRRKLRVLLSER